MSNNKKSPPAANKPPVATGRQKSATVGLRKERPSEAAARQKAAIERSRILDWADIANEQPDLPQLLVDYRAAQLRKAEAEADMDALKPEIQAAILLAGDDVKTIDTGTNKVTWVRTSRKTIVAELLIDNGVSLETVTKSTKITWSEYPLVSPSEQKEGV